MSNIWKVFSRDVTRLFRVRKAWVVIVGVIFTPALYAWLNISAFWDPYSNTGSIEVAVVNLDEGASSELTGPLDVGALVVDELHANDQLGWQFMAEDDALEAVKRGDVYAAIVIPKDFSRNLLSITTGDFVQPRLEYHVNEKVSAISPKITDVGASQLDRQITRAFSEQVAAAATEALRDVGYSAEAQLLEAQGNTLSAVDEAESNVSTTRERLGTLQSDVQSSREGLALAGSTLTDVDTVLTDVQTAVTQAQSIVASVQDEVIAFGDAATDAYLNGTVLLAEGTSGANIAVTEVVQSLEQLSSKAESAITDVSEAVEANGVAIERLRTLLENADADSAVAQRIVELLDALEDRNATDQQLLSDLQALNSSADAVATAIQDTAGQLDNLAQDSQNAAVEMRTVLEETLPGLNESMSALTTSAGAFSAALDAQKDQLSQAQLLLTDIDEQLVATSGVLDRLDENLDQIDDGIQTTHNDLVALSQASIWSDLSSLTGLDTEQIAQFIASPVSIDEHVVFHVNSYGSAMAALFTNLSLWIGAFVLMVIFKLEVDPEGVDGLTVRQAYFGRFLLLGMIAVAQALVVCIGDLMIGVQTVSSIGFVATGVFTALAYLSVIYALCVAFGHVGRGLCILLVVMQIPGASGLYPIEMMPGFFRDLYPFLPFTYGIDAMRETIGGLYQGHYWYYMAALAAFVAAGVLLGLVLRRRLANIILMFNRQIGATDLFISETVHVKGSGYRLSDIVHALQNRQEYHEDVTRRSEQFAQRYPILLRVTLLTGLLLTIILAVAGWLYPSANATLLAAWLVVSLIIIGAIIALEYVKESLDRAQQIANFDDSVLSSVARADIGKARSADGDGSDEEMVVALPTQQVLGAERERAEDVVSRTERADEAVTSGPEEPESEATLNSEPEDIRGDESTPVVESSELDDEENGVGQDARSEVACVTDPDVSPLLEDENQLHEDANVAGHCRSGRHRADADTVGQQEESE